MTYDKDSRNHLKKKTLKQARASQRHLKQLSSQINYFKQA
jgi:hypothetical protein